MLLRDQLIVNQSRFIVLQNLIVYLWKLLDELIFVLFVCDQADLQESPYPLGLVHLNIWVVVHGFLYQDKRVEANL